jgi:hypothetical protein
MKDKNPSVANGMFLAIISMAIFSVALMSEQPGITGQVVAIDSAQIDIFSLREFKDVNSVGELSAGKYYLSREHIIYYIDDTSRFPVAKIVHLDDAQKDRFVYIDASGNLGYLIE